MSSSNLPISPVGRPWQTSRTFPVQSRWFNHCPTQAGGHSSGHEKPIEDRIDRILLLATGVLTGTLAWVNLQRAGVASVPGPAGLHGLIFEAPMDFHFKAAELALWSTACGIFGWLVKSHFSSGSSARKHNFQCAITSIREQFGLVRDDLLVEAHAQSLPRIREESGKIRNDIGRRKWEALNLCVSNYSGLTRNDIENRNLNGKPLGANQLPPADYALGRARLCELLEEMLKHAE